MSQPKGNHSGGGPNSGKTMGFRGIRPDGSTRREPSKAKAQAWAGDDGRVVRIVKNHNHTVTEQPV
jgi:hypothetical protein